MVQKIDWESQIGRRLKLRDLHVFSAVVERGSMGKAAQQLGVSTAAVSEVIADLEHALGVRLLDRVAQGIEPTIYGDALLKRSVAVFDELKQSIRDIEFLSDATVGEVHVACSEAVSYTLLPEIILRLKEQYPRVEVHANSYHASMESVGTALRERRYDCVLMHGPLPGEHAADDLNFEMVLDDTLVVAAAADSRWTRRRKIDLAKLINEPWVFGAADTWYWTLIEEIFRARGVGVPKPGVTTLSIFVRARLLATSPYLSIFATSVVRRLVADHYAVTALPVDLPSSIASRIVTLKNRTLSPVVERFLVCVREVAAPFAGKPAGRAPPPKAALTRKPLDA